MPGPLGTGSGGGSSGTATAVFPFIDRPLGGGAGISFGTPGASAVGDTAATGSATTLALSDHRHSREAFGTPVVVNGQTTSLATGSLTTLARADHVHTVSNVPVLLASTTLTSAAASYTFSSIPSTYKHLRMTWQAKSEAAYPVDYLVATFNSDVIFSNSNYWSQTVTGSASYAFFGLIHGATNYMSTPLWGGYADILNYSQSFSKQTLAIGGVNDSTSTTNVFLWAYAALYIPTTVISSMKLQTTNGSNFIVGSTFQLYGIP